MDIYLLPLLPFYLSYTAPTKMPNTICYFDINIAGQPAGRLTFELFDELLPKVCLLRPGIPDYRWRD
jgi:hypothetical protein